VTANGPGWCCSPLIARARDALPALILCPAIFVGVTQLPLKYMRPSPRLRPELRLDAGNLDAHT